MLSWVIWSRIACWMYKICTISYLSSRYFITLFVWNGYFYTLFLSTAHFGSGSSSAPNSFTVHAQSAWKRFRSLIVHGFIQSIVCPDVNFLMSFRPLHFYLLSHMAVHPIFITVLFQLWFFSYSCSYSYDFSVSVQVSVIILFQLLFQLFHFSVTVTVTVILNQYKFYEHTRNSVPLQVCNGSYHQYVFEIPHTSPQSST